MSAQADITADEMVESVTGYEEIAVSKKFGEDIWTLMQTRPMAFNRALVFLWHKRRGAQDKDAYDAAMALGMKQVNDFFPEAEEEPMPEEPVTPTASGDSEPESPLRSSLPSVS